LGDLLIFIALTPIAAKALFKKFFIQEVIGNAVPHTAKIDVDCNKKTANKPRRRGDITVVQCLWQQNTSNLTWR
jgi:hypothetical protein